MRHPTPFSVGAQVHSLQAQFAQTAGLPFAEHLDDAKIQGVLDEQKISFRERLFSPFVTLCTFLSQILDADGSCRQAVARLLAFRVIKNLPECSANTGSYCKARQRLPLKVLQQVARQVGNSVHQKAEPLWLWKGRQVLIGDGSTASMPDTPANQAEYPHSKTQKQGLGFPILRFVVIFSLAVGTVLDAAIGKYKGKGTGETALLRSLHERFQPGDVFLADRYYCSYAEIALLSGRQVDVVMRLHHRRRADFRRGQRLGKNDHIVHWTKPKQRPEWMEEATYASLPETMALREVRIEVSQAGFRSRRIEVVTTLLDPSQISVCDLGELYRKRWHAELDLRSLKTAMGMEVLRCQTPAMVHKEIWAHFLVYNLVRTLMAESAKEADVSPRQLSFTGAMQTLSAFAPYLQIAEAEQFQRCRERLLKALAEHRVGDRPDRVEPRAVKRRPKPYPLLKGPRARVKAKLAQGIPA